MSEILEIIKSKPFLHTLDGVPEKTIENAEKRLGLKFSEEYREYLREYGLAFFDGHELTGASEFPRLNVVSVTERERVKFDNTFPDLYVIEQTNIDDITIWQAEDGCIYQTVGNSRPEKICNSLKEYLDK